MVSNADDLLVYLSENDASFPKNFKSIHHLITPRTKIVCVAHISNVLGLVNPVEKIVSICHSKGCKVLVDGAQGE